MSGSPETKSLTNFFRNEAETTQTDRSYPLWSMITVTVGNTSH